jgi:hypothetical protein
MDNRPMSPGSELLAKHVQEYGTQNLSVQDAIGIAEDGASAVGGLLGFIAGLIHRFGHVNHPLFVDKLAEALGHASKLQEALAEASKHASDSPAPIVPSAGDMP